MEIKIAFEEKISAYKDALTKIGFNVKAEYIYKTEDDVECEASSAKYICANITVSDGEAAVFDKEYYLPMDATEISLSDFSEIDEILKASEGSEDPKEAVLSHIKNKAEESLAEVAEQEDEIDKVSKKIMLICAIVLGATVLAAIVLPFIL